MSLIESRMHTCKASSSCLAATCSWRWCSPFPWRAAAAAAGKNGEDGVTGLEPGPSEIGVLSREWVRSLSLRSASRSARWLNSDELAEVARALSCCSSNVSVLTYKDWNMNEMIFQFFSFHFFMPTDRQYSDFDCVSYQIDCGRRGWSLHAQILWCCVIM